MLKETCNQIIFHLLDRNHSLSYRNIYAKLIDEDKRPYVDAAIKELSRLKIITVEKNANDEESYLMPQPIKEEIKGLSGKFDRKAYEYYRNKEEKAKEDESTHLYQRENEMTVKAAD